MVDGREPYVVPLNFGYDGESLFFHTAGEGRKIDILKRNPRVCFAFESLAEITPAEKACGWGTEYKSVIGRGKAVFLSSAGDKKRALDTIMKQYSEADPAYTEEMIAKTSIIEVQIAELSGKRSV